MPAHLHNEPELALAAGGARLPDPVMELRPSGIDLGIVAIPPGLAPFTLAAVTVPVGGATAPDQHDVREIWLIRRGCGRMTLDGESWVARSGDMLYFESRQVHQIANEGTETLEITSIWWSA